MKALEAEVKIKEAQVRAEETEYLHTLSRPEGLEVSDETRAIFQKYISGELTISELNSAIDRYFISKAEAGETSS